MAGRGPSTTPRGRSCRDGGAASRGPRTVDAHSACQKIRTGQDALLARKGLSSAEAGPSWSLYCVCAGHGGVEAANYVRDGLWRELRALLPRQAMPEREGDGFREFALEVRVALVKAFVRIGEQFPVDRPGNISGASVTLALLCGRLLTVANAGDCDAVLRVGAEAFLATVSHSIAHSAAERRRLSEAGMAIAPMSRSLRGPAGPGERGVGRLRCWPGGVATARSIGDVPAGEHVMACPHVFQIMLPEAGARLVMGSTGLWELMKWEDAAQAAGPGPIKDAAPKLVEAAAQQKHRSSGSDVSALVVDVILEEGEIPRAADGRRGGERGQGAGCKGPGEGSARRLCGLLPGICGGMRKERLGPGPDVWRCRPDESQVVANIDGWMMLKTALEAKLDDSCSSAMELTCLLLADPGLDGGSGNHDVQHVSQPPALEPQLPRRPPSSSRSSAYSPRTTSTGSLPSEDQEAPHGRPCPSERSRGGHFVMSNPLCDVDGVWTPPRETDAHVGVRNWARGEPFKPAGGPDAAGAAGRPSLGFLDSASSDQRAAERREAELSQGGLGCPPSDGVRPSPDKDGGEQCTGAGRRPEDEWGRKAPFVTAPSQWKSNALCSREDDVDVMEVFRGEETWEFDNPDHHSGSTTPTFVGSVSMDVLSNLIGSAGPFTWEAE